MSDGVLIALITAGGALLLGLVNMLVGWRLNSKKQRESDQKELVIRLDKIDEKLTINAKGLQAGLRFNLHMMWENCHNKGFADNTDRANFLNLYERYHNLGANGVMDHIKEEFLELPLQKRKPKTSTKKAIN